MSVSVFAFDKYYQTQPPVQIGTPRVGNVLEYLVFSGCSLYFEFENKKLNERQQWLAQSIDAKDAEFIVELHQIGTPLKEGEKLKVNFGYKRKRATFETKILWIKDRMLGLERPEDISLTNLRRNPRLTIDRAIYSEDLKVSLKTKTSIGQIEFKNTRIFEFSQLGMSLFLSRQDALLLPGDQILELNVTYKGSSILRTSGIVSRVDTQRMDETLADSYQIIMLFRDLPSGLARRPQDPIQRSAKRIPVLDTKPCFFSAEHPFFPGRKLEGQIYEISSSGMACMLEKTAFPIIRGMRFTNCQLQLPYAPLRKISFEIAHVDYRSDGENNQFRLGGEFISASVELLKDISNYEQKASESFIQDLTEDDFDLLWEFMFETNFIYQKKRQQIQSKSKEILETYHRLLSKDNPIVKKIVFKEGGDIKGHIAGIRFFDHAWLIQHLNAAKSGAGSAAQSVLSSMVEFLYDSKAHATNNIFYVVCFYRPNNIYPAILFGESAKRLNDRDKISTIDFSFGTLLSQSLANITLDLNSIQQDTKESIVGLSDLLVRRNLKSFLRAFNLSSTNPTDLKIQSEFKLLGLERNRHIIMAESEGSKVYALVEQSSPGLNLSEITNSIYLFSDCLDETVERGLMDQVLAKAYREHFEPRDIVPTVMIEFGQLTSFSVAWSKIYTCWILAQEAMYEFKSVSEDIFGDFRTLISEFRAGSNFMSNEESSEPRNQIK